MIRHIWSVLCSQSVTDVQTNNVSLINVIEQLEATLVAKDLPEGVLPFAQVPLEIVSLWERSSDEGGLAGIAIVDIIDAAGKRLGTREMALDVSSNRRCRSRLVLNGLPLTGSGRYVVLVSLSDADEGGPSVVAEIPLEVSVQRHAVEDASAQVLNPSKRLRRSQHASLDFMTDGSLLATEYISSTEAMWHGDEPS